MPNRIHQEVVIAAAPERVYRALTDGKQFSAMSGGAPAEISGEAGAAFSCFGGMVTGRNIELQAGKRIVQAWRAGNWEEGVYSLARFELKPKGAETLVVFDHTGFPEDGGEHLEAGWKSNYWEPLKKFLA